MRNLTQEELEIIGGGEGDIRMITTDREATEQARNVASGTQEAIRQGDGGSGGQSHGPTMSSSQELSRGLAGATAL